MNRGGRLTGNVSAQLRRASYLRKWLILGAVIGIVAGLGAIVFTAALRWATEFFLGVIAGYTPPSPAGEGATSARAAHFVRPWSFPSSSGSGD